MRSTDASTRTVVLVQALRWVRATVHMLLSVAILALRVVHTIEELLEFHTDVAEQKRTVWRFS